MPKSNTKTKTKAKVNKTKRLPTYEECQKLEAWHAPWNKKSYKTRCESLGCQWSSGVMGSYCEDPITVTNRKIEKYHLHDRSIKLAKYTKTELNNILRDCNQADKVYLTILQNNYGKRRLNIIKLVVKDLHRDLIINMDTTTYETICKNARREKINCKKIELFLARKTEYARDCFDSKLGNKRSNYLNKTWEDVLNTLKECGSLQSIYLEQARYYFDMYSCNSPHHMVNEKIGGNCWDNCDCSGSRKCSYGNCDGAINRSVRRGHSNNLSAPKGSWINSARNYSTNRNVLTAELKTNDGRYVVSRVCFNVGDTFSNRNGHLVLDSINRLPGGSWRETSRNVSLTNNILFAQLRDANGKYIPNMIIVRNDVCLENKNGRFNRVDCF